jgi:hypothetical protein
MIRSYKEEQTVSNLYSLCQAVVLFEDKLAETLLSAMIGLLLQDKSFFENINVCNFEMLDKELPEEVKYICDIEHVYKDLVTITKH